MAIKIGSNFTFQGEQPNFERDRFATKAAMKAFPETSIDDGHLSYCAEDGNTYQFKSSNSVDAVTGKWRVFKDGFGADTISTEPNQFLAGPINTQGNIGLRKIDVSDLPDLSSKYLNKEVADSKFSNKVDIKGVSYIAPGKSDICVKMVTVTYSIGENEQVSHFDISFTYYSGITNISVEIHKYSLNSDAVVNAWDVSTNIDNNGLIVGYLHNKENNKIEFYCIDYKRGNESEYDIITAKVIDIYGNMPLTWDFNLEDAEYSDNIILINHITTDTNNKIYATPDGHDGRATFRHLVADDIPDLKSKYQPINGNGIQEGPRAVGLSVGYRAQIGYLKALISVIDTTSQVSPDWYYATDGTLQDIKTKIPKVTLDDAVSTTSDNGVKNSVITKYVDGKVTTINSSITDVRTSLESTQTDFVDLRNKVNAMPKVEFVTQEKYTADKEAGLLDANTIYYIK